MTTALTPAQIEILRRARQGAALWHGDLVVPRLSDEVALLASLRLIERNPEGGFRLTDFGRRWMQENVAP